MSLYDKASLVLIPSGTKTSKVYSQVPTNGDGDFTFSRSTAATRVNASGNIEKETQNLLIRSNDFNNWTGKSGVTLTSGQSGYDGTNDAWLVTDVGYTYQSISSTGVLTYSVYAKAGTADSMRLRLDQNPDGDVNGYFNLSTGVVSNATGNDLIKASIEDIGSGWYRCSVAFNSRSLANLRFYAVGNAGETIYIQDAQLEQGLVARDYIETTTTAIYGGITDNVPRLDYTDSSCPALLLEPQRTNLLTHGEYFNSWTKAAASVTNNSAISPEGVQNAHKVVADTTNSIHTIFVIPSVSASTKYVFSLYVKQAGYQRVYIRQGSATDSAAVYELVGDGSVLETYGSPDDTSISSVGNGWYRITLTKTTAAQTPNFAPNIIGIPNSGYTATSVGVSFAGDGTSGVYIYGAQLEEASYATSYIPTYGSAVTRNAEGSIVLTNVADIVGQTEGTIYIESYYNGVPAADSRIHLSDGTSTNNWIFLGHPEPTGGGAKPRAYINNAGVNQVNRYGSPASIGFHKYALAYKTNDVVLYFDGDKDIEDTLATIPTCNQITLSGAAPSNTTQVQESRITKVMVFPTRLSNEELATLTTI